MQEARIRRLRDWADGRPRGPHTLEIGLTMACNADCLFCWRQHDDATVQGGNLSVDRWKGIIDEAAALGVEYMRVIGEGEPTLHPRIRSTDGPDTPLRRRRTVAPRRKDRGLHALSASRCANVLPTDPVCPRDTLSIAMS